MRKFEVYLTDAEYDTVKIRADKWYIAKDMNIPIIVFVKKNNRDEGIIIAEFNFNNVKGFMEVTE